MAQCSASGRDEAAAAPPQLGEHEPATVVNATVPSTVSEQPSTFGVGAPRIACWCAPRPAPAARARARTAPTTPPSRPRTVLGAEQPPEHRAEGDLLEHDRAERDGHEARQHGRPHRHPVAGVEEGPPGEREQHADGVDRRRSRRPPPRRRAGRGAGRRGPARARPRTAPPAARPPAAPAPPTVR